MTHALGVSGSYPLLVALWLLPLAGAAICWAFGPALRTLAGWLVSGIVGASFVLTALSWSAGTQQAGTALGARQALVTWLPGFDFGLLLDPLSLLWTFIITGVGFLIVLYSVGYMEGDRAYARFFAYMSFFVFAMLTLVLSDNFAGLLVGWGLVGLASYFLIGFWFERPSAVAAARKAFVINVVGDAGMMFAIFLIVANVHSISFGDAFAAASSWGAPLILAICVALFIGAAAKSAQVPLHTWLPDAMEGPTPVSALIHAATMVTAGVYLVARCAPLWSRSPEAQLLVGTIGGVTALAGAILGTAQWDIKRILAYSTMSQIGYMIMGVGVGAYEGGVAHFFTHAFFKAQLFLTSGLVIHALANEQDVRQMGGLWKKMPFAFWAMLTGVLSICGVPGFSGFFSKDQVIYGTLLHGHPWLYAAGVLTAGITAYYMFRLLFIAFLGEYRGKLDTDHLHLPGWIMNLPVGILVVPTVAIGGALLFGGENSPWARFFAPLFGQQMAAQATTLAPPISEGMTSVLVFLLVIAGFAIAWWRYASADARRNAVARLSGEAEHMPAILANRFYVDEAIELLVVRPAQRIGLFFGRFLDPHVIDGAVRELAFWAGWLGAVVRSFQTGLVRAYALILVFGAACFIVYYAIAAGGMMR
ncbi:MAG TPA: NADH-quinone oxidoreductase subunit L [Candidatus Cybelea sp.]|jgi:NADH-quinone oxidoreductase subunit L|nr:NADH-quinone oxidoreductase subunit L [Candidatus Cybelea sp.]